MVTREGWIADPERGRTVASHFGAKKFVLGSVVEAGLKVKIHASIYDTGGGAEPVRVVNVEGEPARMLELIDELSGQIRLADVQQPRKKWLCCPISKCCRNGSPLAISQHVHLGTGPLLLHKYD